MRFLVSIIPFCWGAANIFVDAGALFALLVADIINLEVRSRDTG
jgi:hypothetical protein